MKGRVVVVSPYRDEYGPARVLEHVCRGLAGAGYEPVVAAPHGARITAGLAKLEPRVHEVSSLATFPRTLNAFRLVRFFSRHLAAAHRIQEIAENERALAVYSASEAIFAGSLAATRAGMPSVVHAIGMSIQSPRWVANIYIRFLGRLTDQFVACSAAVADLFAEHGVPDAAITVAHNGISVEEIEAAATGGAPTEHRGPRVGMVAAYDPRKGHELFVEAAAHVAREFPDARFYLIGGVLDGQRESVAFEQRVVERIRRLGIEARVERTGYVAAPHVYDWVRAMDVIVVPSRTEAFAHALLEAMACRRPVVATGIEGNLDALVDGHSGLYVRRDPAEMAAAISQLLAEPEAARAMGEAAHLRVARFFDLSATLPPLGAVVDGLTGAVGPAAVRAGTPSREHSRA
jgi:glycosyltransferase involved in cell wall biosynthesis